MKQFISADLLPCRKGFFTRFFMMLVALAAMTASASAQQAGTSVTDGAPQANAQANIPAGVAPEVVAALEKRVKNLEQQITDLRTMIGTFASMGRGGQGGDSAQSGFGGQNGAPAEPRRSSNQPSSNLPWRGNGSPSALPSQQGLIEPRRDGAQFEGSQTALSPPPKRPDVREDGVASDQMGPTGPAQGSRSQENGSPSEQVKEASVGPASGADDGNAQLLYNDAYSHLLRRDFPNAEKALGAFIKKHPQSRLVGNAQYWLGETFFARSKYRPAADAFLKSYRNHPDGIKAPNSLMKLAFSLARLGQKGAACKTFDELNLKYPGAPNHVKQRAGMERRRTGCN